MEAWSSSYTVEVWKGFLRRGSTKCCTELVGCIVYHKSSYTMEARRVLPSWLAATKTIKESYVVEVWRSSYAVEVWKVVSSWLARSSTIKGSNAVEVQKVVPSWLDSLNTVNDSYAVDAWSSSYTTKVCKFFYRHGSADCCIELVCCIKYHKDFYAVEVRGVVPS